MLPSYVHKLFDSRLIDKSIDFSSIVPRYVLFNRSYRSIMRKSIERIISFISYTSLQSTLQRYLTNVRISNSRLRSMKFYGEGKKKDSRVFLKVEMDKRFDIDWQKGGARKTESRRTREKDRKKRKR